MKIPLVFFVCLFCEIEIKPLRPYFFSVHQMENPLVVVFFVFFWSYTGYIQLQKIC